MHSCRPADRSWLPGGGLQEDVGRRRLDGAFGAADDACQSLGPLGVGHNHVVGGQAARLPVEARQFLAVTCAPDDDPPAREATVIEGMHWLPAFEHDVVRDVDDVADRPDAGGPEPRLHPWGRRRNGDPGDQAPYEPAATIGGVDADQVGGIAAPRLRDLRLPDGQVENGPHLSRNAKVAEEIRAVRLDLEFEDGIAGIERVQILSRGRARVENHDSRRVFPQAELDRGAEHPR